MLAPEPWMYDYILPFGTETWDDLSQQHSLILRSLTAFESPQSLPTEKSLLSRLKVTEPVIHEHMNEC